MEAGKDDTQNMVFLDREGERETLLASLPPVATAPELLIILGPTGVGKSSLTGFVTKQIQMSVPIALVDPYLRGGDRDPHRAYEGYFLQHCVAAVSDQIKAAKPGFDTFENYVRNRGWKNLKGFDVKGTARDAVSPHKLVGRAIDATERVTGRGNFSPEALLKSDDRFAIEICAEYFRQAACAFDFVLVVQEAQHCDTTSLRHILQCLSEGGRFYPMLEYTTEDQTLQKRHQVQIDQFSEPKIWHIDVLPWPYVAELLERHGQHNQDVIGEFRAKWDGNLRTVSDLQYRVAFGTGNFPTNPNQVIPHDAVRAISERMSALGRAERFVLALLKEHNEPITREVFEALWQTIDPTRGLPLRLSDVLAGLSESYLSVSGTQIGLNNDDVATAHSQLPDAALYTGDARRLLLDHYNDAARCADEGRVSRAVAIRHATRLAALIPDPVLLEELLDRLDGEIEAKGDPTLYVDHVIASLRDTDDLGPGERSSLAEWAARHAYRSSNFDLALKAIEIGKLEGPMWDCVRAHSLIEEIREPEAGEIAAALRAELPYPDADLVSDLILGNLDLVEGNLETCARRLDGAAKIAKRRKSLLLGHIYRLLESAVSTEAAIDYCEQSARIYAEAGLERSAAQSRITVTRHLARRGEIEAAKAMLDAASGSLKDAASSRQFFLNNQAAVELLDEEPDFANAEAQLRSALLLSRDKFSDLTILQNLAIAIWQGRGATAALGTIEQALSIIREVNATTSLLADTVGHTAFVILTDAGEVEAASEALAHLRDDFGIDIEGSAYWSWRFGLSDARPDLYAPEIMDKPYHPSFLSQWQLDWEVVRALFP